MIPTSDIIQAIYFFKAIIPLISIFLFSKKYFLKYNPIRKYIKKKLILLVDKKFLSCGINKFNNKDKVSTIFIGNLTIIGEIILIINKVYKNQSAPITPFSGYKNIVLIISIIELIFNGSLNIYCKISIIEFVKKDIVKNGIINLKNFDFTKL